MDILSSVLKHIQTLPISPTQMATGPTSVLSDPTQDQLIEGREDGFGAIIGALKRVITAGSVGSMVNTGLDQLGLPDVIGDIVGGVVDACMGNYVGAAANALDAAEDLAKSCGEDDIAGYLKMGSQLTGMVAGGPGQFADVVDKVSTGISLLEMGQHTVEALQNGDMTSVAQGVFGMIGQYAGLDPEHAEQLTRLSQMGLSATTWVEQAMQDGELDLSDLSTMPLAQLLTSTNLTDPQTANIVQSITQTVGRVHQGMPPMEAFHALIDQIIDKLEGQSDEAKQDVQTIKKLKEIKDLILTIHRSPEDARAISELLHQGLQLQQTIDLRQHRTHVRV